MPLLRSLSLLGFSAIALAQSPVCDVTCTPNMGSSSYPLAASARAKMLNARGSSSPIVAKTLPLTVPKTATVIGSQSYNYTIPILSIPGRAGLDLTLNLYYNSRVWDVDTIGNTATFNADRDFPSYGFRLDFGYVEKVGTGASATYIVTENDGAKHQLLLGPLSTYDATDGTYLSYDAQANALYYKNGTIVYYEGFPSQGSSPTLFRPTQIRDTNGNCIFLSYLAGHDQFLQYIVDTGNRTIVFNYTQSGSLFLLHDISEAISGGIRTYATFQWGTQYGTGAAWYNFTPSLAVNGAPSLSTALNVITSCTYANNTGYSFAYGDWGIVNRISNFSAANTQPLTVRSYVNYNFPAANAGALTDAPSYTQQTISPDGTTANASTWTYSVTKSGTGVVTSMTVTDPLAINSDPSGAITTSTLDPSTGLLTSVQVNNGVNVPLRTTGYTWTTSGQGTVPSKITTTNDAGQTSYVQYAYDPSGYGNISDVFEYDFGSVLKRHTVTTYQTAFQPYIAHHILNLATQVLVQDGAGNTIARTDMAYDGGSLTSITGLSSHDDAGHGTSYTARGNLTSVKRFANAAAGTGDITRAFTYNTLGNLLTAQLDCCNAKTFTYSIGTQYNYPDSVVRGPSGGPQFTSSFVYDNYLGLLLKSTDENGQLTQYQYDSMNRTTAVLLPPQSGTVVQANTSYDDSAASPNVTNYTTNTGNTAQTLTTLDGLGHVMQVDNRDGSTVISTTKSGYDKLWRQTQISNPFGPSETPVYTTTAYDGLNRVTRITPPSAGYKQYAYSGNTVVVTDPAGKQRKNYSDALGRLIEVDEPGWGDPKPGTGKVTINGQEGQICTVTLNGNCRHWIFDSGTVSLTVNGATKSVPYGSNSNSLTIASALATAINGDNTYPATAGLSGATLSLTASQPGANTNYTMSTSSSTGDPTDFGGPSFGISFPLGSNLSGGIDGTPEGSPSLSRPIVTTYAYDVLDNLTSAAVAAMGPVNGVTYTGQPRTYVYDSLGRPTSVTTPESGTVLNFYADVNNNSCANDPSLICRVQDARGIVKTMTYDGINRPLTISYSDGTPTVTYGYDNGGAAAFALDRVTSITEGPTNPPVDQQTYAYDNFGRITSISQIIDQAPPYVIQYGYNPLSQLATITYPSGHVVTQGYDTIGRLASVAGGSTTYLNGLTFNAAGEALGLAMGNGVQGTFTYNDHLQLSKLRYFKNGSPDILNLGYDYTSTTQPNNNGQIQAVHFYTQDQPLMEDQTKSQSFTYDAWSRLKAAQTISVDVNTPGTWSLAWGYDRLGNRKQQMMVNGNMPGGVNQPNFTIDETTNRIVGFTYDNAGNLTNDGANAYGYDGANRLKSVNGSAASYTYFGSLRIKKVLSSATTRYIYSGDKPIAEYVNGSLSKEYIYAGSTLIATVVGTSTTYHHPDHLSNRAETDANGAPVRTVGNLPYGDPWYELTGTDPMKFTSYIRDSESGLDYAMFRQYNSGQGRFMSADYLAGTISAPQSLNRFAYTNDPVNYLDPLGLSIVSVCSWGVTGWQQDFFNGQDRGVNNITYGLVCEEEMVFTDGVSGGLASPLGGLSGAPKNIKCSGVARVLQGNAATIGKPGGFSGSAGNVRVTASGAAVIPSQWGNKSALRPYLDQISGVFPSINYSFTGVVDVIGGVPPSGFPPNSDVKADLMQLNPGKLILELPGAQQDFGVTSVILSVPSAVGCPAGTGQVP